MCNLLVIAPRLRMYLTLYKRHVDKLEVVNVCYNRLYVINSSQNSLVLRLHREILCD